MNLFHEWPLVLFTLSVQAAVGLHLALLTWGLHGRDDPSERSGTWDRRPSLLVGVLMAVALIISLLHLGAPINALLALTNLDQSWLSWEILAALSFLGSWGVHYWLGKRPDLAPWTRRALAWFTGMVGIVLVWVMARIYMVPARPLWDHWLTAAGFFLTTILLGTAALAAHAEGHQMGPGNPGARSLAPSTLILAGLVAVMGQIAVTLVHPMTREVMAYPDGTPLVALRLLLLLSGAFFLVIPVLGRPRSEATSAAMEKPGYWSTAALLLLGVSEVVGRMLFYAVGTVNPF